MSDACCTTILRLAIVCYKHGKTEPATFNASRSSATTARACPPPLASGGGDATCSGMKATDDQRRWPGITSSGLLGTRPPFWPLRAADQLLPPLVPGYEAPVNWSYSHGPKKTNRCRRPDFPIYSKFLSRRLSISVCRPSNHPYLCFSASLMDGLDAPNKIDPGRSDRQDSQRPFDPRRPGACRAHARVTLAKCSTSRARRRLAPQGDVLHPRVIDTCSPTSANASSPPYHPAPGPVRVLSSSTMTCSPNRPTHGK